MGKFPTRTKSKVVITSSCTESPKASLASVHGHGKTAMETLYKLVNGETVDKEILVQFTLITKDNVDQFLK